MVKDQEITIKNHVNQQIKRFEKKLKSQPSMVSLISQRKSQMRGNNIGDKSCERTQDLGTIQESSGPLEGGEDPPSSQVKAGAGIMILDKGRHE